MFHSLIEAFKEGGWGMYPILCVFIVALVIAVERTLYLLKATFDAKKFIAELNGLLRAGNMQAAVGLCHQMDRPLTRIIGAGYAAAAQGEHRMLVMMDQSAYGEIPRIEKRTGYLALLGNVATLAGLFGTIIGLIKSFKGVSKEGASEKATMLAAGISEAMNCTAFGLLTGIMALLAYSILNGMTQGIIDQINHMTLRAVRVWRSFNPNAGHAEAKPIAAPGPHLRHHVSLSIKGHKGHKKGTFASLQLTPMIDMFIVVLIFLLMTFNATGEILFVTKDIKLPFAGAVDKLERAPVIAISFPENDPAGGVVTLDGSEVSTAKELLEDGNPDWKIVKLTEQLEVKKHNFKLTNPNKEFPGEVIVQADQNVDFKIIKKVMYSCGLAGYANVHFAVTKQVAGRPAGSEG